MKRKTFRKAILIAAAVIVLLAAAVVGMCLFIERPAVRTAEEYQSVYEDTVIAVADDGGVTILPKNGDARDTGIIFYVGAQIRPSAYIPLLARLAGQGYSCFIPDLTCNMAAMEPNAAGVIISEHPEISSWFLAGHSMGGYAASGYAANHPQEIDGLILAASYVSRDISDTGLPVLSVLGDTDGVLNRSNYDKCKEKGWNPADFEEVILAGGNHAQFGDYGEQPRDNRALISAEEQQEQTAEVILDWLNRHEPGGGNNG